MGRIALDAMSYIHQLSVVAFRQLLALHNETVAHWAKTEPVQIWNSSYHSLPLLYSITYCYQILTLQPESNFRKIVINTYKISLFQKFLNGYLELRHPQRYCYIMSWIFCHSMFVNIGVTCLPRDPRFADSNPVEVNSIYFPEISLSPEIALGRFPY